MTTLNLNKPMLKAIAGIDNFDLDRVLMIARAAQAAGVPALDIAADPELVKAVKKVFNGTLFVSGLEATVLADCVAAGANVVELGNFDALYTQGKFIDATEVLSLSQEFSQAINRPLSITIPGHLSLETQCELIQQLAALKNIALVQTEGAVRKLAANPETAELSADEKVAISLRNTAVLANASHLPVMAASGFDRNSLAAAVEAGAAAIGVGSAFNRLTTENEMTQVLTEMMTVMETLSIKQPALAS